jgi:hypothetical protein
VVLPQNSLASAAAAFLDRVLARFRALAQVLMDQIDHRIISQVHSDNLDNPAA